MLLTHLSIILGSETAKTLRHQTTLYSLELVSLKQGATSPGEDSYMEQTGMLVGNFEFNP